MIKNTLMALAVIFLVGCASNDVPKYDAKKAEKQYKQQVDKWKESMTQYASAYKEYTKYSKIVDVTIVDGKITGFSVGNQLLKPPVAPTLPLMPRPPKGTAEIFVDGFVKSLAVIAGVAEKALPIKFVVDGQSEQSRNMRDVAVAGLQQPAPNIITNTNTTTSGDTITSGDDNSGQINGNENGAGDRTNNAGQIVGNENGAGDRQDNTGQVVGDNNGAGDRNDNSNQGNPNNNPVQQPVVGCMDSSANNYNRLATVAATCTYDP